MDDLLVEGLISRFIDWLFRRRKDKDAPPIPTTGAGRFIDRAVKKRAGSKKAPARAQPVRPTAKPKKKPVAPKKTSLRKEKIWSRIEYVQAQQDEVLKELGKKQTISVAKIVELNNNRKMPTMMKHAVVAIEKHLRKITEENRNQRFVGAHNIAFWAFRRYGYINKGGFAMTGRGHVRDKMHRTEDGGSRKNESYATLYNAVFKTNPNTKDTFRHKKHPKVKGS